LKPPVVPLGEGVFERCSVILAATECDAAFQYTLAEEETTGGFKLEFNAPKWKP